MCQQLRLYVEDSKMLLQIFLTKYKEYTQNFKSLSYSYYLCIFCRAKSISI